jgi:uncharacterized protein YlxW (UPF0749 family)
VSGLVFALAGLMFAAAASTSQGTDLRAQRALELRDLVRQKSLDVAALDDRVAIRRREFDDLSAGRVGDPAYASLRAQIAARAGGAGLTAVTGRAVQVTLNDAPPRDPADPLWQAVSANDVIVHQSDVQAVVNALWKGGATAMQIMDQRIIATSAIRCVGNTLLLQDQVYSPPYVITATGPVRSMRDALTRDPGVTDYREWGRVVGLGYDVTTLPTMVIPAYGGPIGMNYATPVAASATPSPSVTAPPPALPQASSGPSQ